MANPVRSNQPQLRGRPPRAAIDRITGLQERSAFERCLREETQRAAACGQPLSLMIICIDDFADLASRFGTDTADTCAQIIVETVTRTVQRVGMFSARLAGGEFGLILPATDAQSVALLANNIVHAVREVGLRHPLRRERLISVSAGVATSDGHFDLDGQALWVVADQAAHRAQARGGDRFATSAD